MHERKEEIGLYLRKARKGDKTIHTVGWVDRRHETSSTFQAKTLDRMKVRKRMITKTKTIWDRDVLNGDAGVKIRKSV